jgi:Recombination endonuclease VII
MPSGGRPVQFGDSCKICGNTITQLNCVYKAHYVRPYCVNCDKTKRDSVPSRSKEARRNQYVLWKFDLTPTEYKRLVELHGNACAICRKPNQTSDGRGLSVDHDHETGRNRGLLCNACNQAMGLLKEDEVIIWNMLEYLKKHKWLKAS